MTWAVDWIGDAEEIGLRFDDAKKSLARGGMIAPELDDMDNARDFCKAVAIAYGPVKVSASGHWNVAWLAGTADHPAGYDPDRTTFGRISVTIEPAPKTEG